MLRFMSKTKKPEENGTTAVEPSKGGISLSRKEKAFIGFSVLHAVILFINLYLFIYNVSSPGGQGGEGWFQMKKEENSPLIKYQKKQIVLLSTYYSSRMFFSLFYFALSIFVTVFWYFCQIFFMILYLLCTLIVNVIYYTLAIHWHHQNQQKKNDHNQTEQTRQTENRKSKLWTGWHRWITR